jgi:nitrogen-specific signal transduction histidine kinase
MAEAPPLLHALLEALPEGALVFDHKRELVAGNRRGRACRHCLASFTSDAWQIGEVSLDALLHRVLAGGESTVRDVTPDPGGGEMSVSATRLEVLGERLALVLLRPGHPADGDLELRRDREHLVARLLPGLAHEIRGPLTTISGLAQVLALSPDVHEDIRDGLELVPAQIDRADALLRNAVAFSRGPQQADDLPIPLNLIVSRAVELVAYPARAAMIDLGVDLEPGLALLDADPEDLLQMVLGALMAALDATLQSGRKGPLHLRTRALPGRIAALELTFPAATPGADGATSVAPWCRLARRLGGEVVTSEADGDLARVTIRLPGYTDREAAAPQSVPRTILIAEPDLDHGLACLEAAGSMAERLTIVTGLGAVKSRLERRPAEAALLDLTLALALPPELLPALSVLSAPPGQATRARTLAARLGIEWIDRRDGPGWLRARLGLEKSEPATPRPRRARRARRGKA